MPNDISVTLTSDTRKFAQGMQSSRAELSSLQKALKATGAAVAGFLTFSSIKGAFSALSGAVGQLDDLAAQAERLGVSTSFLSEIQYAAKLSDTEIEALNGGLEKLERNLGKATLEGGDLQAMLGRVGLDAFALAKSGPEAAFLEIADAVSRIANPMQRAVFVTDLFGKSGQSLIGILGKGKAGIESLRAEARLLGVSLKDEVADQIGAADDAIKRLDAAWTGMKNTLAIELAPALTDFVGMLTSSVIPAIGKVARELVLFKDNVAELLLLIKKGPLTLIPGLGKGLDELRKSRLPEGGGGIARPLPEGPPVIAAKPGDKPAGRTDALDLGGIAREFKSFARPLAVESAEGFSAIARALTKPTSGGVAEKQLAEARKANAHLAKIEAGLANQPKIAPAF